MHRILGTALNATITPRTEHARQEALEQPSPFESYGMIVGVGCLAAVGVYFLFKIANNRRIPSDIDDDIEIAGKMKTRIRHGDL